MSILILQNVQISVERKWIVEWSN